MPQSVFAIAQPLGRILRRLLTTARLIRATPGFRRLGRDGRLALSLGRVVNAQRRDEGRGTILVAQADDPHVLLDGVGLLAGFSEPVLFKARLVNHGPELATPTLYLDRGSGYRETSTVDLSVDGDWLIGLIPDLGALRGLRLDPSERLCTVEIGPVELVRERGLRADETALWEKARAAAPGEVFRRVRQEGVRVIGAAGVRSGPEGELVFSSGDPRIVLAPAPGQAQDLVCYTFCLAEGDAPSGEARLYLDYDGRGFSQAGSIPLAPQPDGAFRALVAAPARLTSLRWDPPSGQGRLRLTAIGVGEAPPDAVSPDMARRLAAPPGDPTQAALLSVALNADRLNAAVALAYDYERWVARHETWTPQDRQAMAALYEALPRRPRFSFVVPVYNADPVFLAACIASMQAQAYPDFEICIADDCSTDPRVGELLAAAAAGDPRIKLCMRPRNGHISEASNSALALATGDFVVLVDHDDVVPEHCLLTVAAYLDRHPQARVLFSDEDKLDSQGRRVEPYFKPDFNRFLMFGQNMVSHLGVYQRALLGEIGGFRKGYEGSQDYDLALRCLSRCRPGQIVHIPHVLYHWRMAQGSTALCLDEKGYAAPAARRALDDYFQAQSLPFASEPGPLPGVTQLRFAPPPASAVSIVIPTRDGLDVLRPCLDSLWASLDDRCEVILVDNGTTDAEALAYLAALEADPRVRRIEAPGAFNFSRLCNLGVEAARGDIICLLNNDTELLSPGWLSRARTLLDLDTVGAVGARLVYPDQSLQSFGLVLGMGAHGVAGSPHHGLAFDAAGQFGRARLIQEFSAVTAACLFVRRRDYLAVGGFDLELPVAYNDVDFCLKLGAAGLAVLADPEILLVHKESKTRGSDADGQRARRLDRDAAFMRRRWGARLTRDPCYNPNLALDRDDMSLAAQPRAPWPWRDRLQGEAEVSR